MKFLSKISVRYSCFIKVSEVARHLLTKNIAKTKKKNRSVIKVVKDFELLKTRTKQIREAEMTTISHDLYKPDLYGTLTERRILTTENNELILVAKLFVQHANVAEK